VLAETIRLQGIVRAPYVCGPASGQEGLLLDIARIALERGGDRLDFKISPFNRALRTVRDGEADALVGILRKNAPDLVFPKEEQAFSQKMFYVQKNNRWRYTGLVSLLHIQLGTIQGYSYGMLDSYLKKFERETVQSLSGKALITRNLTKLELERIDAVIEDNLVMDYYLKELKKGDQFAIAGELPGDNIYIAFSQSNPKSAQYAQQLSDTMEQLRKSGKLETLLSTYGVSDWKKKKRGSASISDSGEKTVQYQGIPQNLEKEWKTILPTQPVKIVLATAGTEWLHHGVLARKFKEFVEKYSKNKITIQLYMGNEGGREQENVMRTATGEIQMSIVTTTNITPFAPVIGFTTLPYIFPTLDSAKKLFRNEQFTKKISQNMVETANILPLGWSIGGYRMLTNSKRPVSRLSDLAGLNIRVVPNPIMIETYRALGVEPIPLIWADTFDALKTQLVDGKANTCRTSLNMLNMTDEYYNIQKYITGTHFFLTIAQLSVNANFFEGLPENYQQIIQKAAKEASESQWALGEKDEKEALQYLLDHGMEYVDPANNEHEWIRRGRSIWPDFYNFIGGESLVNELLKIIQEE